MVQKRDVPYMSMQQSQNMKKRKPNCLTIQKVNSLTHEATMATSVKRTFNCFRERTQN